MKRLFRIVIAAVVAAVWLAPVSAQERVGGGMPQEHYRAGWTFTPAMGFGETYDDNISLFGAGTADGLNRDYVASYFPEADLRYVGKHTLFAADYAGSFLNYRTFSALNRWDQHGKVELRRQESARLKWFADASAAAMPSTDLVDFGGIPYRHVGAQTFDGRGGVEYAVGARDLVTATYMAQSVTFDRPETLAAELRGGRVHQVLTTYRRRFNERLAAGADYTFRRSQITGDITQFDMHEGLVAADYDLSPSWSLTGGGGFVYLLPTAVTPSRTGPAYRIGLNWHRSLSAFHVGYLRSYIPSFGFGGTVQNEEIGASLHMPLFNSRRFYTDHSAIFRNNQPLTTIDQQLPLRSFRTYSAVGWQPQPWARIEVFYARTQQTSLRAGGQLYRNRIGFQIVTSLPMRLQ